MSATLFLLIAVSALEIIVLLAVVFFFLRLKRSQNELGSLYEKHEALQKKLRFNAEIEQELMSTFETRQAELADLESKLEARAQELKRLIRQAESLTSSPDLLRQAILEGRRSGKATHEIARSTGLSTEEVELILEREGS
jgi:biopolymer transport protein ExbB/TolQ